MTAPTGSLDRIRLCKCGCGLTFTARERGRNAKYAAGCQSYNARQARAAAMNQKDIARRIGYDKPRYTGGERKGLRTKQNICLLCFDLPHARPAEGCPKCKLPHGDAPVSRDDTRGFSSAALALKE